MLIFIFVKKISNVIKRIIITITINVYDILYCLQQTWQKQSFWNNADKAILEFSKIELRNARIITKRYVS